MKRFVLATAAAVLLSLSTPLLAQTPAQTPAQAPAQPPASSAPASGKRQAPKPAAQEAPGGGPDKVWVNTNSSTYHCPGDRYYGKTAHGRYMTEAAAKSAGAHGVGGKTCAAK